MPEVRRSSSAKPRHPKRKPPPRRLRHHGFTPTLVIEPSPTLPGSTTTENEMLFWVGFFYRLHQRRKRLIPVHIKTLDCPVAQTDGSPVTCGDGRPVLMRCVREVALREARGHLTWEFIEYTVGVPGVRFRPCSSLNDALNRFDAAPEPVRLA